MVKTVAGSAFEAEVLGSDLPVLVDFYADWCGPCQMIAPIIDEVGKETEGSCKVVKVDIDEAGEIAYKYNVRMIPTIIFFKGGQPVDQITGGVSKSALLEMIQEG